MQRESIVRDRIFITETDFDRLKSLIAGRRLTGADAIWRVLAPIDLSAAQAGKDVENALDLASALVADLTLLSIVDRRQYADGVRHNWPSNAFGSARPELDIGRCGGEVALSHQ